MRYLRGYKATATWQILPREVQDEIIRWLVAIIINNDPRNLDVPIHSTLSIEQYYLQGNLRAPHQLQHLLNSLVGAGLAFSRVLLRPVLLECRGIQLEMLEKCRVKHASLKLMHDSSDKKQARLKRLVLVYKRRKAAQRIIERCIDRIGPHAQMTWTHAQREYRKLIGSTVWGIKQLKMPTRKRYRGDTRARMARMYSKLPPEIHSLIIQYVLEAIPQHGQDASEHDEAVCLPPWTPVRAFGSHAAYLCHPQQLRTQIEELALISYAFGQQVLLPALRLFGKRQLAEANELYTEHWVWDSLLFDNLTFQARRAGMTWEQVGYNFLLFEWVGHCAKTCVEYALSYMRILATLKIARAKAALQETLRSLGEEAPTEHERQ